MQDQAGAAIYDPTPDKRTEQDVEKQSAGNARVDHGVDHVGRLIGYVQDIEPNEQRNNDDEGITLGLVERNDVIANLLPEGMRGRRLQEKAGLALWGKLALLALLQPVVR